LQHQIAKSSYFVDRNGGDKGVARTAGGDAFERLPRWAAGRKVLLPEQRRCYDNNAQSIDGEEEEKWGDKRRSLNVADFCFCVLERKASSPKIFSIAKGEFIEGVHWWECR
jgi:hypothetical protein